MLRNIKRMVARKPWVGILLLITLFTGVFSAAAQAAFNVYLPIVYKNDPVTASVSPTVTATLGPTSTPRPSGTIAVPGTYKVEITMIQYDETVADDEYIEIANLGTTPVSIKGWSIEDSDGNEFFLDEYVMRPDETCRIYTKGENSGYCGLSFKSDTWIWDNKGDYAILLDSLGYQVDSFTYPSDAKITPRPTITPGPATTPMVEILGVQYDEGSAEEDEYVAIINRSNRPVNLEAWSIKNSANETFYLPYYAMAVGQTCRIYTKGENPGYCSLSLKSDEWVWNNEEDSAYLMDWTGKIVDTYTYDVGDKWD